MRHRTIWRPVLAALLGGFLLAVSGCDSGSSTLGTSTTSTGGLVTGLAQGYCLCCGAAGGAPVPADGGSDASAGVSCGGDGGGPASPCEARASVSIAQQLALVTTAITEGLLAIDTTAAATCIAAYQGRMCAGVQPAGPDVQDILAGCSGLFIGYIPAYERCDMTPECIGGSFCLSQGTGQNLSSIAGSSSLGVCFPYEGLGQVCNASSDCDPAKGLECDPVTLTCQLPPSPTDAGA